MVKTTRRGSLGVRLSATCESIMRDLPAQWFRIVSGKSTSFSLGFSYNSWSVICQVWAFDPFSKSVFVVLSKEVGRSVVCSGAGKSKEFN